MIKKLLNTTSLKANIVANFTGNAWSAIIGIIFIPIYLKYIGAEGYGLIGIFASLQVLLSLLDNGLSTTLNKEMSRLSVLPGKEQQMRNIVRTLGNIYWVVALTAGVITMALSPILARYWVHPKELSVQTITYAFFLLSLSMVFQFPAGFYNGGLLGLQRQVVMNVVRITFATLKSVGALLVLMFVSKSVLAFFSWTLLISILQAFTQKFLLWHYLPKSASKAVFDKQELKNVWRFAAGMIAISITSILLTQVDKIILSKILPLEKFGYYTIACSIGMMISQIEGPLSQSYFPKFSSLISLNQTQALKNMYHQACQMISTCVMPGALILVFFSKELIFIWTKNQVTVENTWIVAAIYAYGTGVNGLLTIPYLLTLSYGWTKLGFYQNVFFLILMIPLTILLALKYGAVGGALSWAIINTLCFFITPIIIHNRLLKGEAFKWYWKDTLMLLLVSVSIIGLAKYFIFTKVYSNWVELFLLALTGIISIIATIPFADQLRNKALSIFNKFRNQ